MIENLPFYFGDLLAFAASASLITGYHFYLRARLRRDPNYTIQAVNNCARTAWVEHIMANNSKDLLAVQTLRNSTMASTFLASTAILLIIGVLNLSQQGERIGSVLQSINHASVHSGRLWAIKLLPLLVDFFWAFFCFSLAIRIYNHVGYLINSSVGGRFATTPTYVSTLLNRGGWYYSLGMRSYYMSVPLVFWWFGPYFMLLATLGLITVLYHVDRAPKLESGDQEACRLQNTSVAETLKFPSNKNAHKGRL